MGSSAMHEPHDSSYKAFFSDPDMVVSLLRDFVSEDFVAELDFSTMEKCSGEYVSEELAKRHNDVVWRVRWRDSWAYILLMLEFQSQIDHWMAVRILAYTALLWQDLIKTDAINKQDSLPPVFPIVIYNGSKTWNAATDVAELLAPQAVHLLKYQPRQSYFILDESNVPMDALHGNRGLAAQLIKLERAKTPQEISGCVKELVGLLHEPKYIPLRKAFAAWLNRVVLVRSGISQNISECQDLQEVGSMLEETVAEWKDVLKEEFRAECKAEWEDVWKEEFRAECKAEWEDVWKEEWKAEYLQQGRRDGFLEGKVAGRAEGRVIGISLALRIMLNARFGSYPPDIETKISKVQQPELLQSLLPLAYAATSIREFGTAVDKILHKMEITD